MTETGQGPLWDWVAKKSKERNLLRQARIMFPTKESLGALYRTVANWTPMQKQKFAALMRANQQQREEDER